MHFNAYSNYMKNRKTKQINQSDLKINKTNDLCNLNQTNSNMDSSRNYINQNKNNKSQNIISDNSSNKNQVQTIMNRYFDQNDQSLLARIYGVFSINASNFHSVDIIIM